MKGPIRAAALARALAVFAAAPIAAEDGLVIDAFYTLFRRTATVECAYVAPSAWFASASAGGWYWPDYPTGLEGYTMREAFDGDVRLSAGYAARLGERCSLYVGAYAGAWVFHSAEAIEYGPYGLSLAGGGFQFAPRAGLSADIRWLAFGSWGFRFGLAAPWQLFSFTSLGLSEALPLIGIKLGASLRLHPSRARRSVASGPGSSP